MNFTLSEIEKNHYSFGACHVFALALHRELGYEMNFFWDTLPNIDNLNEDEPNCLIHAYSTSDDGRIFDVQGETNKIKIGCIYSSIIDEKVRIENEDTVKELMQGGILMLAEDDEISFLQNYIKINKHLYY